VKPDHANSFRRSARSPLTVSSEIMPALYSAI
jgi:hypothetical protein